jgi:large subunit ribosomal protein L18
VVRISNKYVICQLVKYETSGDKTIVSVSSQKLADFGWKHSGKNIVAAYLSGYLAGKLAIKKKNSKAVFDMGLQSSRNSKVFAALKGLVDAGVEIPHGESRLPTEERLGGAHISEKIQKDFKTVKEAIDKK